MAFGECSFLPISDKLAHYKRQEEDTRQDTVVCAAAIQDGTLHRHTNQRVSVLRGKSNERGQWRDWMCIQLQIASSRADSLSCRGVAPAWYTNGNQDARSLGGLIDFDGSTGGLDRTYVRRVGFPCGMPTSVYAKWGGRVVRPAFTGDNLYLQRLPMASTRWGAMTSIARSASTCGLAAERRWSCVVVLPRFGRLCRVCGVRSRDLQ